VKEYEATLELGSKTDTHDLEGKVIETKEIPNLGSEEIIDVLKSFKGEQLQTPPMYSAKKVNGQRLYKMARKNIEVKRDPCTINIFEIELIDFKSPLLRFKVQCSKGTYIRVLGSDISEKFGSVGHLIALKRIRVGDFTLNETIQINELKDNGHSINA
jgi:tRNA pseudouridine55 synthase